MTIDALYLWTAILGGALFVLQVVLQLLGGGVNGDTHIGIDGGHPSADLSFKMLSLQGLTAFFMMFGLVGLALRIDSGTGVFVSLVGAAVAGVSSGWVISRIFRLFSRLQSSGTLDMWQAMGVTGTVYLTVAKEKPGKVQINIANRLMTVDAVTDSPEPLVTGSRVRVVNVVQENVVVVEPE